MPFPPFTPTVPVFLRHVAERSGDDVLIVLGARRLSYAEAERESAELARGLVALGATKGSRIGILLPNGPDFVLAWLAATRIGAVAVPINTFYRARELHYVLRHADVQILLTADEILGGDCLERLEAAAPSLRQARGEPLFLPELPHLRAVRVFGATGRPFAGEGPSGLPALARARGVGPELLAEIEQEVHPADPMVIIYSSGSTAEPKGAIHSHGAVIRHTFNLNTLRDLRREDVIYSPMPFFWVGGLTFSLVGAMHAGARLICEERFEPGRTLELLERERVTVVAAWPHFAKAMTEHPSFGERDLSSVRTGTLHAALPESRRPRDPELRHNSLGMTETCGPHTWGDPEIELPERLRGSFGRGVPGLEHRIVDPETGETLPPGTSGEICVRGYSLMQGLVKREREETFDVDGFYHTGDRGRFDEEGHLFFEGRLGEMIKTGGANVAPREVELRLEALPEVRSAFVVGIPDPDRGEVVAAAVLPAGNAAPDPEALRRRLREELAAYKVPRHLLLFREEELPFTDSGKIDKRRLVGVIGERLASRAAPAGSRV